MNKKIAKWQIAYGVFLVLAGVMGYLSNPEKAKTALLSGGSFGGLSILWGVCGVRGYAWSRTAALVTAGLLAVTFTWRSSVAWVAVMHGNGDKFFTACLISLMLTASVIMFAAQLRTKVIRR